MASSIVCAVDDSPHARVAARLTADLAQRLGVAPIAVHAYPIAARTAARTPYPVFPLEDHLADKQRGATERVVEILSSAGVRDVRVRAELGEVAHVVTAIAEEEDAALIALGTRGPGALRSLLRGSVASTLFRMSRVPVLAVPSAALGAEPRHGPVVAAVGSPTDAGWIRVAEMLARAYEVPLLLAHVLVDGVEAAGGPRQAGVLAAHRAFEPALGVLADGAVAVKSRVCSGSPGDALLALAGEVDARMIVSGTRGRGALHAGMSGSTARQLACHARTPVAVCPPRLRQTGPLRSTTSWVLLGLRTVVACLSRPARGGARLFAQRRSLSSG